MEHKEFKAMISLLDDSDSEVVNSIVDKIKSFGYDAIPYLESEWGENLKNPAIQEKIEELLQDIQMNNLKRDFQNWTDNNNDDLLEGLWLVSRIAYPETSLEKLRSEVNKIFTEAWIKTEDNMHPLDVLKTLNEIIFGKFGFEPNIKNFHSVDNSLFNKVLENRMGNPVTLSCIYILIADKLGLPIYGVNLPFLFITIYDHPESPIYINPFNKGQIFAKEEIEEYLRQIKIKVRHEHFQACSNIDIVNRILTNLAYAYQKKGDLIHQNQVAQIFETISKA